MSVHTVDQQSSKTKRKSKQKGIYPRNRLTCANPHCGWVYKYAFTDYESGLLFRVRDVSNLTCCEEPRVTHFCPSSNSVTARADQIRSQLLNILDTERTTEVKQRLEILDRHVVRLQRHSGVGCHEKYKEYKAKVAEANELLRLRTLYSRAHDTILEKDFPEALRMAYNQHLRTVLNTTSTGVEVGGLFRPLEVRYGHEGTDADSRYDSETSYDY